MEPRAERMNATPHREAERDSVELEEPALVFLSVYDVERVEQGFHRGVGAPERGRKSDEKCHAQGLRAFRSHPAELLPRDVDGAAGQESRGLIEMLRDGRGIGEKAVQSDKGRNPGKMARML